ncbi:acetaldehyde dehydrogenase (acetylating) [Facklamia sp. DSM 111018]|uniref:Acetaldehyde dehydrogenase n=1 Tax=Facklamia lactis TaxID=2749967 RepID=A0ABS0LPS0_9LACT|nr:acetaldehyde dehydrogenase (acetylating) [Facklamia lactis]MBG9980334.1 acetaldehyde dehydrogenase (acetylating) [Facklamia lactis]MBG9986137.1 acetaldehyde dehydrogenase (acetylating) [Facklamia lactis]
MARKIRAGIIGPGNIGSDLMMKLMRSDVIELVAMFGIDQHSRGMKLARENGLVTFDNGIDGIYDMEETKRPEIIFDSTSAGAHQHNNEVVQELGIRMIDLTPAALGPFTSPTVNLKDHIKETNVNMITCGGQATTPIVAAVNDVADVEYAEIVATISSQSAGPGTRANIDEFTETTALALEKVGGADKGKAIIILNPAEPPILMRDTIYCQIKGAFDPQKVEDAILKREKEIQKIVPGYRLRTKPVINQNIVTVFVEVEGAGDYLPVYSGNLDIMTASALGVAEEMAKDMIAREGKVG